MLRVLLLLMAGQTQDFIAVGGQSLGVGLLTGSAVSTAQVGNNVETTGMAYNGNTFGVDIPYTAWPLVALVEPASGANIESPRSGVGNYYRTATGRDAYVVNAAQGSALYSQLGPGTLPWTYLSAALEAYGARGGGNVKGLYIAHGESDVNAGTTRAGYAAVLVAWQAAWQAKVRACTLAGASATVPLYLDQVHSWTAPTLAGHAATSPIPLGQIDACRANPGKVILVGPKYWLTHNAGDGIHMTNTSSRTMGAQAGKAIAFGPAWQPLWITAATRSTTTIIVTYHVPCVDLGTCGSTRLTLDTTTVTGKGSPSYGFEYTGATITAVAICTGVDAPVAGCATASQVAITINANAAGTLRYAYTGVDGQFGGPTTGPRGNLRDTDTSTWASAPLYNWAMTDEWSIP